MSEVVSVKDADVSGKRVLVRVDFNVPITDGKVTDDTRIKAALPTIELLRSKGAAKIILMTHLGRPEGKKEAAYDLAPVRAKLAELGFGEVELLDNLRFDPREEAGDESFAKELAAQADVYVNEAFSNSHRTHASMVGVTKLLPAYAGLNLMDEISHLTGALTPPANALAVIGGAKFETKQPLLEKLLKQYSGVLLGGALGNDLLKARGQAFGHSLISDMPVPTSIAGDERVVIGTDFVVKTYDTNAEREALFNDVRIDDMIVDIGPTTRAAWTAKIKNAPFILWNGPVGIYEQGYSDGTDAIAKAIVESGAKAVVGGGDTIAALAKVTIDPQRIFISTGGGAMLEFLTAGTLPAIEALKH
jgi:phosphoglycerate kinase